MTTRNVKKSTTCPERHLYVATCCKGQTRFNTDQFYIYALQGLR